MCPTNPSTLNSFPDGEKLLMPVPAAVLAAIPAGVAGIGSLIGGASANAARRKEAKRDRAFQERMRNTAWQASVADMEAAGINPALAYAKGPAATPGGAMARQDDAISPAVSSAQHARRMQADLKLLQSQTNAAQQQALKTQSETFFQRSMNKLWGTYTGPGETGFRPGPLWKKHEAEAVSAGALSRLNLLQIPTAKNIANIAGTKPGQSLAWLRYILQSMPGIRR